MREDSSSDVDTFQIEESPRAPWSVWEDAWSWVFPLVAFFIFESFANPGVSVVIACLKFGYADFRTALWLRSDPNPLRGQAHAMMYASRGCFVVTACGFACLMIVGLFEQLIVKNNAFMVLEELIVTALVVAFAGAILGMALIGFGFRKICRLQGPIWMDPTIHRARRQNRWDNVCYGYRNGFRRLAGTVIGVSSLILLLLTGALFIMTFFAPPNPNDSLIRRLVCAMVLFLYLGVPSLLIIWSGLKARRFAARDPETVWP